MNYIDSHVHVWTQDTDTYPFKPGFDPAKARPKCFFPADILGHANASGVDRIVLVQVSHYAADNSYMLNLMREYHGIFSGIAVVDPNSERPDEEMGRLVQEGVRGFRITPRQLPPESWLAGAGYDRMFAAAAEYQVAICPLLETVNLPALASRCEEFPQVPVIIDHLCCIGALDPVAAEDIDRLCVMARYPQVMVKISAFYALGRKKPPYLDLSELIQRVHSAFGAHRLMWASDCPYQVQDGHTYEDSISLVRDRLDFLTDHDREQILRRTADGFFFTR